MAIRESGSTPDVDLAYPAETVQYYAWNKLPADLPSHVVAYGIESGGAFNEKGVIKSSEVLWFHFTNVKVIQKHEDLS